MTSSRKWLLAVAVSSLPLFAFGPSANAQFRVGSDGHALDSSNRIGSGGVNEGSDNPNGVSGNDIVYGNVTGGRQFRGSVPYGDPRAFRGTTASTPSDSLLRDSAGVPNVGVPYNQGYSQPTRFYGDSRGVAPPPDFVRISPGGGYVPKQAPPPMQQVAPDARLGVIESREMSVPIMPAPGEFALPGQVNPAAQPTAVDLSPLGGARMIDPEQQQGLFNYSNPMFNYTNPPRTTGFGQRVDNSSIMKMREELNKTMVPGDDSAPSLFDAKVPTSLSAPQSQTIGGQALTTQLNTQALGASTDTAQGTRQRLLVPPAQQSVQYAELQKRLDQNRAGRKLTDEEAHRQYMEQVKAQQQKAAANPNDPTLMQPAQQSALDPKAGNRDYAKQSRDVLGGMNADSNKEPGLLPSNVGGISSMPGPVANSVQGGAAVATPTGPKPKPLQVTSLADGIKAPSLAKIMTEAESLTRQGKFISALDQYDTAERVAPNNPLIWLGRANAELGATYYARAEAHLRQAFEADPALLMGQYDLRVFLGEERLKAITDELKEMAKTSPREARPMFLLAYIAYNTAQERRAAAWLDLAEKRAGVANPYYRTIRQYWVLPEGDAGTPEKQPELNK